MARTDPVSRRNRPAKPALSQEAIVDAAMALLDGHGMEAVSMRRVAQALDTGPASLYVYVQNHDELVMLMLDRAAAEIPLPVASSGDDWRERLITLMTDSIGVLGRHRGLAVAMFASVPTGPNTLALAEAMLDLLAESGMSPRSLAWAVDLLALYISAAGAEAAINADRGPGELRDHPVYATARSAFAALPPERFPLLVGMNEQLESGTPEQRTRWALNALLNGILATDPGTT
jgi:AcrR family transcriptional regulator